MKPERLGRSVIYENPWVNLYVDKVRFPGGRIIDQHHLLDFEKEAVAVVVENAQGEILFVQSYRYTTDSIEWEIPAGGIDKGESIVEAARREILEETGYETEDLQVVYTYYPMNGIANKVFHVASAQVKALTGSFDTNEVKSVKWFRPAQIQEIIGKRIIMDGYSLTALLLHWNRANNPS
jgi:ADP-ribose pyrophosphatase